MKKNIAIITLLLGVTTAWAGLIADDFNRVNTAYSTAGSTIGANWVNPSSANKFSISNNVLYMDAVGGGNNCILYNNAQQTLSGSGSSFTLSAQVAGHATVTATWQGVVFNYQNASNYYTLRFKTGAAGYQLLGVSNNALIIVKSGNSTGGNFAADTLYTVTVASDAVYDFDFSIKSVDGLTTFVPLTTSVDTANRLFTGGYAGLYLGSLPNPAPDARFDNFSLETIVGSSLCFMITSLPSEISQVSGLNASVKSGQVFLTWNETKAVAGTTFNAFMHSSPIEAGTLSQARQVGHHIEAGSACDWWKNPASFDALAASSRTHGFVVNGKELNPRDGLFVYTVTDSDPQTMYFAVLPSIATSSNIVLGANSLSTAVQAAPALPESIQLQSAPAPGSAVGKSLTLVLHGRGGGTDADNKANFLVFGDTRQGWRDGLARKFVVTSNSAGIIISPLDRTWINRPLLYSWDARDHVPAINTWWYGCNEHIYDPDGIMNGTVVNYTEEHLLYLVRWAQQYYGTDPARTYVKGLSMGATGAISFGFHHPDVVAGIFSDVPIPAYTRRAGSDGRYNLMRLDGVCGRPCDETVMAKEGISVMERMDSERIALEYSGNLPFLVLCNGRNDMSMPWVNNPFFYRALNNGHRGFACYWNDGAHDMGSSIPSDIRDFYTLHPEMALNISYPAFSNSSDNRNPGGGEKTDGDIVGWMNRGIYWSDLEETENSWSVRLYMDGDFLPESLTVDVTPQRLTRFHIASNERLQVNGIERQADANGLLTISNVQLTKATPILLQMDRLP